jgi:hypothetical protein
MIRDRSDPNSRYFVKPASLAGIDACPFGGSGPRRDRHAASGAGNPREGWLTDRMA